MKPKLLLIEDDKIDQMAFARSMAEESPDFECSIAGSIAQAKAVLGSTGFDIVVTDFQLGDGLAFEIFGMARDAPIILTTASGNEGVAVQALKSGAYDYLVKDPDRNYLKLLRFTLVRSIERKKAENQLRLLSGTVRTMSDGVCISDEDDRIIFVNRSFCEVYGYSEQEACALRATVLWADPLSQEKTESQVRTVFWEGEAVHKRRNGEFFDISYSQSSLVLDGRTSKVMVIRDASERKRLEAAIRQSEKIAAVGQLAAGIAHEINNPLCVILGAAQGVLYRLDAQDPVGPLMKSIEKESLRCRDLVQSLLSFSRKSSTEAAEPVDLNAAVEDALALVEAQLRVTKIAAQKTLAPELLPVLINKNQLQQVFINLATNAIHAMKGGGQLSIRTGTSRTDKGSFVFLKVQDTGPGIPPAILPRIFEPFFTTKAPGEGTGLGLALIHEIVKRAGGRIDVQSRSGSTEFSIFLPALSAPYPGPSSPAQDPGDGLAARA